MKKLIVFLGILLMIGCSSTQLEERTLSAPIVLEQSELPPIPLSIYSFPLRISTKLLIDEHGKVASASLLKGSGDAEWDSLAVRAIMKWKYDPARYEDKPIKMWIVQNNLIRIDNPCYLSLAEILCESYDQANQVIAQLRSGKDFGELAALYSIDSSRNQNGIIGKRDVQLYPVGINRILKKLDVGEYTQPMEYGKRFVIFKRMANGY